MTRETIDAIKVQKGQAVTAITIKRPAGRLRRRKEFRAEIVKDERGWPTVIATDYLERGDDGLPTVYIVLSDNSQGVYAVRPNDKVTIEMA